MLRLPSSFWIAVSKRLSTSMDYGLIYNTRFYWGSLYLFNLTLWFSVQLSISLGQKKTVTLKSEWKLKRNYFFLVPATPTTRSSPTTSRRLSGRPRPRSTARGPSAACSGQLNLRTKMAATFKYLSRLSTVLTDTRATQKNCWWLTFFRLLLQFLLFFNHP